MNTLRDKLIIKLNNQSVNESIPKAIKKPILTCPVFDENYEYRPMRFINNLKHYFHENPHSSVELKCALSNAMKGQHIHWFDFISCNLESFEDFETSFKEKFWSVEIQRNIVRELEFGKYKKETNKQNFYNYALEKINLAYDMNENLNEKELIVKLARHFDRDVRILVKVKSIDKINDFLNLLALQDSEDFVKEKQLHLNDPKNENILSKTSINILKNELNQNELINGTLSKRKLRSRTRAKLYQEKIAQQIKNQEEKQ